MQAAFIAAFDMHPGSPVINSNAPARDNSRYGPGFPLCIKKQENGVIICQLMC